MSDMISYNLKYNLDFFFIPGRHLYFFPDLFSTIDINFKVFKVFHLSTQLTVVFRFWMRCIFNRLINEMMKLNIITHFSSNCNENHNLETIKKKTLHLQ